MNIRMLVAIFIAVLVSIIGIGIYLDSQLPFNKKNGDIVVDVRGSTISGYENQKPVWRFQVERITRSENPDVFMAEDVHSGVFYDSFGNKIADSIHAKRMQINRAAKIISDGHDMSLRFIVSPTQSMWVRAARFGHIGPENKTYLGQQVHVTFSDGSLTAPSAEIRHADNVAVFTENVRGVVNSTKRPTYFKANELTYFWLNGEQGRAELVGDVVFTQKNSVINALKANYDRGAQTLELRGQVRVVRDRINTLRGEMISIDLANENLTATHQMELEFELKKSKNK